MTRNATFDEPISTKPAGLHFQTQAMDEMFDVKRQRGAAFHRDIGLEFRGFHNPQKFDTGEAAMCDGELVNDGDTEPCLDQRADRRAEPSPNGYIVLEFLGANISAMMRP